MPESYKKKKHRKFSLSIMAKIFTKHYMESCYHMRIYVYRLMYIVYACINILMPIIMHQHRYTCTSV